MKQRIEKKSTKLMNFFLINKIDKSLVRLRKKKERTHINKIRKKERALKVKEELLQLILQKQKGL